MDETKTTFDCWAVLELFGHVRLPSCPQAKAVVVSRRASVVRVDHVAAESVTPRASKLRRVGQVASERAAPYAQHRVAAVQENDAPPAPSRPGDTVDEHAGGGVLLKRLGADDL